MNQWQIHMLHMDLLTYIAPNKKGRSLCDARQEIHGTTLSGQQKALLRGG